MGDSTDASSSAAQGAQPARPTEDDENNGFFRRIFGAFSTNEEDAPEEDGGMPQSPRDPRGLINLRDKVVEDVAIPKADIVSIPATITQGELVHVFRDSGMTRLPVYEGTLDSPIGFVHLKDFALRHGFNGDAEDAFVLADMLRPLLYVPPSMRIGVLLQKMQTDRRHMALVIDEYGGVDGLVTIEDLIEQVLGEIEDEHDIGEDDYWTEEKPGCYVALAKTPLEEFEGEIGQSLTDHDDVDEEEIDTLGGLVFMLLGRVPVRGEVVEHPGGIVFEVIDADPRRIKRMRVRVPYAGAHA
ncbi:hemolysin family protein [Roseovarius nanhaiticus]|uniref:Magnesium and cobalt transporter n=1 Tax=Roseovarius nanhaiticus TaxID=573024 RepID=A0A1N7G4Q2_9RHOB|nr:hemolysin family protein [Roseovarius nanhaiticus]SEK37227.1 magnesium and cobalt transporter [Roseovarius nanhaiticus]SIS07552.1 magnesium and cobalt transporter [Roseovarius nanhaiticus]